MGGDLKKWAGSELATPPNEEFTREGGWFETTKSALLLGFVVVVVILRIAMFTKNYTELHLKDFQRMVIDKVHMPEDPTFNNTDAYRKLEKDINEMCEDVFRKLREEMQQRDKPAARLEDVTQNSWKRLQARRALKGAFFRISLSRQRAKVDAAKGSSSYLQWLPETIEQAFTSFRDILNEIYK